MIWQRLSAHKKWLWLLVPAGILGSPLLLMAMLIGSRLLSAMIGPVNVWNMTKHVPPVADLAGEYGGPDRAGRGQPRDGLSDRSGFRLGADHRAEVFDLPAYDGFGEPLKCAYRGTGNWMALEAGEIMISINITEAAPAPPGARPTCGPTNLGLFQLLGHSPPYKLWYYIGDPDEEMGLTFVRRGPPEFLRPAAKQELESPLYLSGSTDFLDGSDCRLVLDRAPGCEPRPLVSVLHKRFI